MLEVGHTYTELEVGQGGRSEGSLDVFRKEDERGRCYKSEGETFLFSKDRD